MRYKGVIFDLDGVICFTDKYHYLAWKEMADEIGVYFDETINNRLRGVSRMDSLDIILEKVKKPTLCRKRRRSPLRRMNVIGSFWPPCLRQTSRRKLCQL